VVNRGGEQVCRCHCQGRGAVTDKWGPRFLGPRSSGINTGGQWTMLLPLFKCELGALRLRQYGFKFSEIFVSLATVLA
jgi:hypothetical protein